MVEPAEQTYNRDTEAQMMSLLHEVIKIGNFETIIRDKKFWVLVSSIKDQNFQAQFNQEIAKYYVCLNCNVRQRRFLNGGFFCINCKTTDQTSDNLKPEDQVKLNCLKCFRMLNTSSFIPSCFHMCYYCAYKEIAKGNAHCKICKSNFDTTQYVNQCKGCGQNIPCQDLYEIRCGCIYCSGCLTSVKKQKKCPSCVGINLLNSESYSFNTRKLEMCIVCETNKDLQEFSKKQCCDLDVCKDCQGRSICPCST